MEEAEIDEAYVEMASLDSAITSIRQTKQEKPPTSPRPKKSVTSSFDYDQHDQKIPPDDVRTEGENNIYQLPKANPTPSSHSQHIDGPFVPPKAAKRTKFIKPVTRDQSQRSSSSQQEDSTDAVHSSPDNNVANKLAQSNKSDQESVAFDADNGKPSSGLDETEQQDELSDKPLDRFTPPRNILRSDKPLLCHPQSPTSPASPLEKDKANNSFNGDDEKSFTKSYRAKQPKSTYQPLKRSPLPSPVLYEKPLDLPPRNVMRPKPTLQSADKIAVTTPANETIQLPTGSDIPIQSNETSGSFNANDDKKSSSEPDKTEQQGSSDYQALKTNPVPSPKAYYKPQDVPPRNILRSKPNNPLSPDKDKESVAFDADNGKLSSGLDETEQQDELSDKPLDRFAPPRNSPTSPASPLEKDKVTTTTAQELTQSSKTNNSFNVDDEKSFTSTYQPLKRSPLPSHNIMLYEKPLDLPPRNVMRPKPILQSADKIAVTTPANETIQSPTGSDIPTQSNETSGSFNANDDKKSSSEPDKTEQQGSSDYQALKTNPVPSSKAYHNPLDVPPRNILRSKPNNPLSPDKDKILQDKIISTKQDKTNVLLTPPRTSNPYSIDPSKKAKSSSLKENQHQQRKESSSTQDENNTREVEPSEQSYTLEEFIEIYPLPQLVSVTEGHYGDTDDFSMSEGIEIIVFFKKKTQAVTATARRIDKTYYIPMNCSLQFSPYQRDSREHITKSYFYKTVSQLLHRKDGLPKVVKVLKGRKSAPALNANELLFPKGLSSKGTHLKFTDIKKEEIRLKLSCDIGFSTNPSDTKMYLADYVENINEFPSSVMVFCDPETGRTMFEIHTGMEMVLQESKMLYSCICSTDVHGKSNYPLTEILTAMPIEIKAIKSPTVALEPIYDTAKKVYETFDLSMIRTSMFLAQNDKHDYTEIRKTDNYQTFTRPTNFYNLELPAIVYTKGRTKNSDPVKSDGSSTTVGSPPLPPRRSGPTSCKVQTQSHFFQHKKQLPQDSIKDTDTVYIYTSMADERRFYLKSFTTAHVLKLLDKMNLGQFKGIFQQHNVDGKMLLSLTGYELEQMGVKDSVSQKRLLDVISGHAAYKVK